MARRRFRHGGGLFSITVTIFAPLGRAASAARAREGTQEIQNEYRVWACRPIYCMGGSSAASAASNASRYENRHSPLTFTAQPGAAIWLNVDIQRGSPASGGQPAGAGSEAGDTLK